MQVVVNFRSNKKFAILNNTVPHGTRITNVEFLDGDIINPELQYILYNPSVKIISKYCLKKYHNFTTYKQTFTHTLTPGTSRQITFRFCPDIIPRYLILYVKNRETEYETSDNKYNLVIDNINLRYRNVDGIFQSFTQEELYEMSLNNNLDLDFNN